MASGVIVLMQFTVFLLIGVLLYVFAQHTPLLAAGERTDRILPLFLVREMPVGIGGIAAGVDHGGGDVECERVAEFAGGVEHFGFFAASWAREAQPEKFCEDFAADDAAFGAWY